MESDKLVIEAENRLIVMPRASIKQLEVTPPPALPFGTIKGAKIIGYPLSFPNRGRKLDLGTGTAMIFTA